MKRNQGTHGKVISAATQNNEFSNVVVIDSGVAKNVINDMTLFKSAKEIDPVEVGLANAHTVTARYEGYVTVRLGKINA